MRNAIRSQRQERQELSAILRAEHRSWSEIGRIFAEHYHVNARAAMRMAHGWSQREAADRWNARWPADPKTFKNFSYWEVWPASTGHAPSLDTLTKLAELYECSVSDLLHDHSDFRRNDPSHNHEAAAATSRRSLLMNLSAGLSLAAASSASVDAEEESLAEPTRTTAGELSGVWHSRYVYPSTGRDADFTGDHYLIMKHHGRRLAGQSLPHSQNSRLHVELAIDVPIATGTWRETTSPGGYYKGATYHGAFQFTIAPNGRRMRGMWLGFGRDFTINTGEWTLTWQEPATTTGTQRAYHLKA